MHSRTALDSMAKTGEKGYVLKVNFSTTKKRRKKWVEDANQTVEKVLKEVWWCWMCDTGQFLTEERTVVLVKIHKVWAQEQRLLAIVIVFCRQ